MWRWRRTLGTVRRLYEPPGRALGLLMAVCAMGLALAGSGSVAVGAATHHARTNSSHRTGNVQRFVASERSRLMSATAVRAGRQARAALLVFRGAMGSCFLRRSGFTSCNARTLRAQTRRFVPANVAAHVHLLVARRIFELSVVSAAGEVFWLAGTSEGYVERLCQPAGVGGCSRQGSW